MEKFVLEPNNYTLLKAIPKDFLEASLNNKTIQVIHYTKDQVIHFDGDLCSGIELILYGQVLVERIDESGNLMTITEFYPDDILGGNLVFSKNPHYPMTVTAKTDSTLLSVKKKLLFQLCLNYPDFLKLYLEYISDHTLLLGDKIKHYINRSIRESVVAYLKNEYLLQNSLTIHLHSSKKSIADRMGVQRTSLSRELQKMKTEGLLNYDAISITILEPNLLK